MNIRETTEKTEHVILSKYASFSDSSRGRDREEKQDALRTVYQRDRDRILHCNSFRRMKHKTQVFLSPEGDHYRTRLTHTLEVSQIARTISRALRLNEDLTEAIALGHDLGHTPFGHAGERALNKACKFGFVHSDHSLRVVEKLENSGEGLNLTWEVRDGIVNHRTSGNPTTLEGQVVRLSDKIAYINHDIDDAIRAGILTEADLPEEYCKVLGFSKGERLDTMVGSIVTNSDKVIKMDPDVEKAMSGLRQFMFKNVYSNPAAKGEEVKAVAMIIQLYEYYLEHVDELPEMYIKYIKDKKEIEDRVVCDYIAGMSDSYSIKKFEELFVPAAWNK